MTRSRYLLVGFACVALGLLVHLAGSGLSRDARDILGDALWACMMAAWVSAVVPRQTAVVRYVVALLLCFAVETSQLWNFPVLVTVRSYQLGRLVFGSGFDPRDFAAYTVGVVMFIVVERTLLQQPSDSRDGPSTIRR